MEMTRLNQGFLPTLMSRFNDDLFNSQNMSKFSEVAVNIKEREKDYKIEMAVPGFNKEDINIELDGNKLSIHGKTSEKNEIKEEEYTHKEFSFKEFERTFTLPKDIDAKKIEADYKNGILEVTLLKPDAKEKIVKRIEVKGA